MSVDLERARRAIAELLEAIGEDPDREGLTRTPQRVAAMYEELFGDAEEDPARFLTVTFAAEHDEMVMVRDIPFASLCEHHLVPFIGKAHVAYIPSTEGRITGLSKLARVVDGSRFDEFKPLYGSSLVTGWATIHGYPIGVLANHRGVLFSEEAHKATQFIQLANQIDVPLLFLQNTTGYMVGKEYEQGGIIKHGAQMINAVTNSSVPHLTVNIGASYGAGNYGMCGRAYEPRFLFSWPNARSAVMGPAQLAGVLSIVGRQSAASRGLPFDEEADAAMRAAVEAQIESESLPLFLSGRLYDDGVIDPRDTRTVLGLCLSVIDTQPVAGTRGYGVFRM